jgi:hypothetical protein
MANALFMVQRAAVVTLIERMEMFEIFAIEDHSSPLSISEYYVKEVQESDVVIMILQGELREGVAKEFMAAKRNGIRIFAYIHSGPKTKELEDFIADELHGIVTTGYFTFTNELVDRIEKDLLEDIAKTYKSSRKTEANLRNQLEQYTKHN